MNLEWIKNGGVADPVTMEPPLTLTRPQDMSDCESKVRMSDHEEPLSLHLVVSKVRLSDEVEHVLDKGVWAATPAMHQGWKIFIKVSHFFFLVSL